MSIDGAPCAHGQPAAGDGGGTATTWPVPRPVGPIRAKACELGLEGIVSKRAGSFYKSGKSRDWLKTKNPNFVRT
jgi:hypothetical protein